MKYENIFSAISPMVSCLGSWVTGFAIQPNGLNGLLRLFSMPGRGLVGFDQKNAALVLFRPCLGCYGAAMKAKRNGFFAFLLENMAIGSDLVSRAKPCQFALALLSWPLVGLNGHAVPFGGLVRPPWGAIDGCLDVHGRVSLGARSYQQAKNKDKDKRLKEG